jgi:hypothetical protein
MLIEIAESPPWLFLDGISAELNTRCHVQYLPGYCCAMPKRRGYSLEVMRPVARQGDQNQRFRNFLAYSIIMMRPSQLVFADKVGQDGRGSRRRRSWGKVGAGCDITEFLNRGKHISIPALYGITGFTYFDNKEGRYSPEDFLSAVELPRGSSGETQHQEYVAAPVPPRRQQKHGLRFAAWKFGGSVPAPCLCLPCN